MDAAMMSERQNDDDDNDDNTLLVNFHDALVYRRDLRILQRRTDLWLNSDLIHFWLRFLQHPPSSTDTTSTTSSSDHHHHQDLKLDHVLLMDPSVTSFLVHQCNDMDEMNEFCRGTFDDANDSLRWIYLPINDAMVAGNDDWWQSTGNHWSLLRIIIRLTAAADHLDRDDDNDMGRRDYDYNVAVRAEHYNSMSGTNESAARSVYDKMRNILLVVQQQQQQQQPKQQRRMRFELQVRTIKGVPQQSNGYDCGLHVLWMIEQLLQQQQRRRRRDNDDDNDHINDGSMGSSSRIIEEEDAVARMVAAFRANPNVCHDLRRRMAQTVEQLVSTAACRSDRQK